MIRLLMIVSTTSDGASVFYGLTLFLVVQLSLIHI